MQANAGQVVEAAYLEHRLALVRHLASVTRDADVAEDLAQEAFLRLAREIEAGRAPEDAGGWLHRVGSNLAMSRGRHLKVVDRRSSLLPRPAEPAGPEQVVCDNELAIAVGAVLAQMSGTERHALTLAANGYGGIEIAAELGRTPGAVRTLLCRARAKIRADARLSGFAGA
jgi:RNA polymerase sigma-70 factor (ECF subfamily)